VVVVLDVLHLQVVSDEVVVVHAGIRMQKQVLVTAQQSLQVEVDKQMEREVLQDPEELVLDLQVQHF
jgi:hypothetical protein